MSIALTTQPRKHISGIYYSHWNNAYNPYVFEFTFSAIPVGATSLKVEVQIMDKTSAVISTHESHAMNLVALLDIQRSVQSIFTDVSIFNENVLFNDPSLFVGFFINYRESYYNNTGTLIQGGWNKSDKFFAIRGVVQIPNNPNIYNTIHNLVLFDTASIFSSTGEFLTMFSDYILPVWSGYPRDLSLIISEFSLDLSLHRALAGVETITQITQDVTYPGYLARLELSTNPGHTYPWTSFYVKDGAHITPHACSRVYSIENITTGSNPFYVRWRNQKGGFDYWMFEKRQVITDSTSETKSVHRDLTAFSSVRSTHKVYSRRGSLSYLVGATNLNQVRYDAVNSIRYSSMIQYWDGSNWLEIIPADDKGQLISDKPAGEIEYEFFFPERQMSY
jgi:hypothetical protein